MICMMVPACQLCYHILPIQLPNYLITKEMVWNPLTAGTLAATTGTWTPASAWTPGWWWTKAWCRPPPWTWTPSWATRAQTWATRATTWAAWAQCSTNPPTVCGKGDVKGWKYFFVRKLKISGPHRSKIWRHFVLFFTYPKTNLDIKLSRSWLIVLYCFL